MAQSADENNASKIQEWMEDIAKNQEPRVRLIFDKEAKKLVAISPDDPRYREISEFVPQADESPEFTPQADENNESKIQEWMEKIAKAQQSNKRLIFDEDDKKLVAVSPDDPRYDDDKALSFGAEDAKRFGGWPDYLTIAASIASVTQAVLMVVDMWSRRAKKKDVTKIKGAGWGWNEVKEIHALMSDGNRVQLCSWLSDPDKVKDFLNIFRSSSVTPKPVNVTFILDNGSKVQMNVTGSQDDDYWLEMFIKQLKSTNNA